MGITGRFAHCTTEGCQLFRGPCCRAMFGNVAFYLGSTHFFREANATNMPPIKLISAHLGQSKIQKSWEITGGIAHCAVIVGELFGGPCRSPVEGPFVNCRVFAGAYALFAGSNVLRLWRGGGRRRIFTYRECEILTFAVVL